MSKVFEDFVTLTERYGGAAKERGLWYHGTDLKNLKSILSRGLIPNPAKRAWDEDPEAGLSIVSRQSIGGVYVTTNLMTAISSAGRKSKMGTPKVLVVMDLQPRTFVMDEDDLNYLMADSGMGHLADHNHSIAIAFVQLMIPQKYMNMPPSSLSGYLETFKKRMLLKIKDPNPKLVTAAQMPLETAWRASILRKAAYLQKQEIYNAAERIIAGYREDREKWDAKLLKSQPSSAEGEAKYRKAMDRMTRLFKSAARPSKSTDTTQYSTNQTARVMEPIKYTGSNKIVAVITFDMSERPAILILQKGKLPAQFTSLLKKGWGNFEVKPK